MNGRVLVIALVAALVVLGGGWYLIRKPDGPTPVRDDGTVAAPPSASPSSSPPASATPVAPAVERKTPSASAGASAVAAPDRREPGPTEVAPTKGTLRVSVDVPGAQIFLDRNFIGASPVTIPDVLPGPHRLNVSAEGFEGVARELDVQPGPADITVRLREVRLSASISVVHRHRVGSCNGQLFATPQGIRYETSNRDDAFSVALQDVQQFDVDYLEKNLRVKVGSKTFNFTDPEGNADRLFVFHRDVDKARVRLAKGDAPASEP